MDFELEYRYALECELNSESQRNCDQIRNQLIQLVASQRLLPSASYNERLKDLLREYSSEIDKKTGLNTFIDSSFEIVQHECHERDDFSVDKWRSTLKKKLDNGDLVRNKSFDKMKEISEKFRKFNRERLISLLVEDESNDNSPHNDDMDDDSDSKHVQPYSNQIQQQRQAMVKSSPTRVSGLFRKKTTQTNGFTRALFTRNTTSSQSSCNSDAQSDCNSISSQESNKSEHHLMPIDTLPVIRESSIECYDNDDDSDKNQSPVEIEATNKKSEFTTGLELHLVNQIVNDEIPKEKAQEIIDNVRKEKLNTFKDPMVAKTSSNSTLINDERLKGIEPNMIELIQNEIIANLDNTDWSNIAGLEYAKSTIQQVAILPLKRPDLFTGLRSPPKGILLFGPPGTGKTMIGRCIASQAKATFFSITSSTLTSKWIGDGEKTMKTLFQVARCLRPSVIFIDEIDSLLTSRSDSEHEASRRMKTEFLSQFDGLSNQTNEGLLVIGTTNRPHEIDEAVRRRFAARLYVPLPDRMARKQMLFNNLKNEKHSLTDEQIDNIAERTESFSGSDIKILCCEASMVSISEITDRLSDIDKEEIREICFADFEQALQRIKPSFSRDDLGIYESWNEKYGSN
ncbi:Fidgetin-like protein 1 [Dermatophagoides pteronyssinus]|uniref:Fidgetin-like protein 1 n=1 Tax=Dermatophagoides pteronyssinus TaxID=6956 RepID=A0ABQ8J337_DERPT|nr:Fidgetin-like protein 1 [Dermatophagoides pteronyssinus]